MNLDTLYEVVRNINFISESYKVGILKDSKEKGHEEIFDSYKRLLESTKMDLAYSVMNLCKLIIDEYNYCKNPKITFEKLKAKIGELFENPEYSMLLDLVEEKEYLEWTKNI